MNGEEARASRADAGDDARPDVRTPSGGPSRPKGGRPRKAERAARVRAEMANIDLTIAEQALSIARSPKASPAVRAQALQVLKDLRPEPDDRDARMEAVLASAGEIPARAVRRLERRLDLVEALLRARDKGGPRDG